MDSANRTISRPSPRPALVRSAMGGFFLLGGLMALLGALLPVWANYVHFNLATAGDYFLAFNLGIFAAAILSRGILGALGLRRLLALACFLAAWSMALLAAILSPTVLLLPLVNLGFATGMLTTGLSWLLFDAMTAPMAGAVLSLAGVFFGAGAVSVTLLISTTLGLRWTSQQILLAACALPVMLGLLYMRQRSLTQPALQAMPLKLPLRATSSPMAVLLTIALFFQSANEWAAGGWLAIYWIRRLGVSSQAALTGLALYWTALTLGKLIAPRVPWLPGPFRQLTAAVAASIFGCILLFFTAGIGGATVGVLCLGAGLGAAYPLIVGLIGERFPYYHPGFFNGFFSLSLIGGMLAPWSVGHLANAWSIAWVIGVPAAGAVIVYVLLVIVLIESRAARLANTASSS